MNILVTGHEGFIGHWLVDELLQRGENVFGIARQSTRKHQNFTSLSGDISDKKFINKVFKEVQPDRIYHLAALNNINDSFMDPEKTLKINVFGSLYLLEAMKNYTKEASFVSIGSSAEYGSGPKQMNSQFLQEEIPLHPTSPYGISKATQKYFAELYAEAFHLNIFHIRPFAIIGPRKKRDALSDFCRRIVAIERGGEKKLSVGGLESKRDFVDVRDCVEALLLVSEKGKKGEVYNICQGENTSIQALLDGLKELATENFEIIQDKSNMRKMDDKVLIGDASKIKDLGWKPKIGLKRTLVDTLNYWREQTE